MPHSTHSKMTPGPWKIDGDDTPWTEGDASIAQEYGEPFGQTEILFSIVGGETGAEEVVARLPWLPMGTQEEQARLRANARAIAAVPEMVDYLRMIANGGADGGYLEQAEAEARALLQRIEGR